MSCYAVVGHAQFDIFHCESQPHYLVCNAERSVSGRCIRNLGLSTFLQSRALRARNISAALSFPEWTACHPEATPTDGLVRGQHLKVEFHNIMQFVGSMSVDMSESTHAGIVDAHNLVPTRGPWCDCFGGALRCQRSWGPIRGTHE